MFVSAASIFRLGAMHFQETPMLQTVDFAPPKVFMSYEELQAYDPESE